MADAGKNMDDAIKKAKAYQDALESVNKKIKAQDDLMGSLANEMGIAYSSFVSQTKKTQEERLKEIKLINDAKESIQGQKQAIAETVNKTLDLNKAMMNAKDSTETFSKIMSSMDSGNLIYEYNSIKDISDKIVELKSQELNLTEDQKAELKEIEKISEAYQKETLDFLSKSKEDFESWVESNEEVRDILDSLPLDSIEDKMSLIKGLVEGEVEATQQLLSLDKLDADEKAKILGLTENLVNSQETLNGLQQEHSNQMKTQTNALNSLWNSVQANSQNFFKGWFDNMKKTNQALKDAQKNFGLAFDGSNYGQMASLTSEAARFNMSVGDTLNMMGDLGEELATIDTQYLASATKHFVAIQKATGLSSKEVTTIAGEMMRAGSSAKEVETYIEGANKMAKLYGVNSKKALGAISRNMDKMRHMGFTGGVESLAEMTMQAERLRINVDSIFNVAERARSIEGAMDMAAELQLAGGSFAQINPMELLSAARKGPKEMGKILTQMGDDIGHFNENNKFEFDAVDADRLRMVAKSTGMELDELQKMIQKNAEDAKKADLLGLSEGIPDDARNFLNDMTKFGEDGGIEMSDDLKDLASSAGIEISNVKDLEKLSQDDIKKLMDEKISREKTLEEQAKANQSFQDSVTAFKDSVMSLFTVFQPVLDVLTQFMQAVNSMGPIAKGLVAALVGFIAITPKLNSALEGFKVAGKGLKGAFGKGKNFINKLRGKGGQDGFAKNVSDTASDGGKASAAKGSGGGLKSLAEGLKAMGDKDVFKGIAAVALAGPALVLFLPAIPGLLGLALVGALGKLITAGFNTIAKGFGIMGQNFKNIAKGALAIAIAGAALIPFAFAAQMMSEVDWLSVLAGLGMLTLLVIGLTVIGALLMGPQVAALALGIAVLIGIGVGLAIFGASLLLFAVAAERMQGLTFDWLSDLGVAMMTAAPGLALGGLAMLMAAPGLIAASIALTALAIPLTMLSNVNLDTFSELGSALMSVIPGLLAFSMAGLAFLNPVTFLGMTMMIGVLGALTVVMVPLSAALMVAADGMERFSNGLEKLQASANNLDLEKLEALKDLSLSMAVAGIGGAIFGNTLEKIAEALAKISGSSSGGSGGSGGNKKIEINLKLNGRDLQNIIVDDTEIVT